MAWRAGLWPAYCTPLLWALACQLFFLWFSFICFKVKRIIFVGNQNPKLATKANCFFMNILAVMTEVWNYLLINTEKLRKHKKRLKPRWVSLEKGFSSAILSPGGKAVLLARYRHLFVSPNLALDMLKATVSTWGSALNRGWPVEVFPWKWVVSREKENLK